ncbi:hypothetical protein DFH07DRAFT_697939, partial [Mycena maculata]
SSFTSVPSLPEEEKFDGLISLRGWKTKVVTLAKARGLGPYIDGTLTCPPIPTATTGNPTAIPLPPDATPVYSMTPSREEWVYRDACAYALVVLNVKNPEGLGMKRDGSAAEAFKSL